MKKAGATQAQIQAFMQDVEEDEAVLLESNKEAFAWFLEVDDLFKIQNNVVVGLDVQAVRADADMTGREIKPDDYKKLRHIGRVAAQALNEGKSR